MDQHPIPQNVTGFQFKLIGSMTVKQFGYVAVGVIAAVITYYLPIPGALGILIKILFIPLFGSSGAIVAFVPIDGRPIDVMAGNFMKALFTPNQYVYHKQGKTFSFTTVHMSKPKFPSPNDKKQKDLAKKPEAEQKGQALQRLLMNSSANKINNPQDAKEAAFLKSLTSPTPTVTMSAAPLPKPTPVSNSLPTIPTALPTLPTQPPLENKPAVESISVKEATLEKQLEFAKREEAASHDTKQVTILHQKTLDLEKQLDAIRNQKQALEEEIKDLKTQLLAQKTTINVSSAAAPKPAPVKQNVPSAAHVRAVPKEMNKKMGLLVSDTPNVVSGVVKDPRGNVLPNILVEIKDKSDNPVRAFKTNALGNFASATPLPPGNYTITLEDPKKLNTFDSIQITATNQIMLPIEIISYDKREQLRKDLFS
jgi:hypothetical protein